MGCDWAWAALGRVEMFEGKLSEAAAHLQQVPEALRFLVVAVAPWSTLICPVALWWAGCCAWPLEALAEKTHPQRGTDAPALVGLTFVRVSGFVAVGRTRQLPSLLFCPDSREFSRRLFSLLRS